MLNWTKIKNEPTNQCCVITMDRQVLV